MAQDIKPRDPFIHDPSIDRSLLQHFSGENCGKWRGKITRLWCHQHHHHRSIQHQRQTATRGKTSTLFVCHKSLRNKINASMNGLHFNHSSAQVVRSVVLLGNDWLIKITRNIIETLCKMLKFIYHLPEINPLGANELHKKQSKEFLSFLRLCTIWLCISYFRVGK